MDNGRKTPDQKFEGMEFQIFSIDYHTWGCPIFFLEASLQGGLVGLPKWDPRTNTGVYIGHSPFHAGSVYSVLNTRTDHVATHYHVVFDDTFSTVEKMRNGIVPRNCKTW